MNQLVFFGLMVMSLIKIIALIININVYLDSRDKRYILYISGWSLYFIGGIIPIISDLFVVPFISNIFLLISAILNSIGFVNISGGYFSRFVNIDFKSLNILILSFTGTIITLFIIIGLNLAMSVTSLILFALFVIALILPVIQWNEFKKNVGKSIVWYYSCVFSHLVYTIISIFIISLGYSFGVYNCNDPVIIFLNYFPGIVTLTLLINYFYHVEYSLLAKKKDDLIEDYSHNIGNVLQGIYLSTEIIRSKKESSEKEKKEIADLIDKKLDTALKFLKEIREL